MAIQCNRVNVSEGHMFCLTLTRHPQPRLHKSVANGMGIALGNFKQLSVNKVSFTVFVHNLIKGVIQQEEASATVATI